MTTDRRIRVNLVSAEPNWLMTLGEVLSPFDTQRFTSLNGAFSEMENGTRGIVVIGPSHFEELVEAHSLPHVEGTSTIIVVESATIPVLKRAMALGAGDVVDVPKLDDLPATVRAQAERIKRLEVKPQVDVPRGPGRVVVVTSAKSGQGATTVAANLAVTLTTRGPCAVIEGDPLLGDMLAAFGYRQGRTEVVAEPNVLQDHWVSSYLYRHPSGVMLVLPPPESSEDRFQPEDALEAVAVLQEKVETVVIDVPLRLLGEFPLHRVADEVLFVSRDRRRDLTHVASAVQSLGIGDHHAHLVVSDYVDGRTPKRKVMKALSGLDTLGRIPETPENEQAFADGEPLVASRPDDAHAQAYVDLVTELADVFATSKEQFLDDAKKRAAVTEDFRAVERDEARMER